MLSFAAALIGAGPAAAHHVTDFLLSTPPLGGDELIIAYDFATAVAPLGPSFTLGTTTVFSGTNPGFDTADGDEFLNGVLYPIFPPGVVIVVELVDSDGGRTAMKLNGATLTLPGDQVVLGIAGDQPPGDLHHHPEWFLFVEGPAERYAEGRIAFRVTSPTPGYAPSRTYTLRLTNGHLPPSDFAADGVDRASVRCQEAVGHSAEAYGRALLAGLRRCLDRLVRVRARAVAGADVSAASAAAGRACVPMVGKLARLRARATSAVERACGPNGSGDFSAADAARQLALVRCRIEEAVAASYFRARTYLSGLTAEGRPLPEHFPCLVQTSGEEEGRS
jgi:hypothetical protein